MTRTLVPLNRSWSSVPRALLVAGLVHYSAGAAPEEQSLGGVRVVPNPAEPVPGVAARFLARRALATVRLHHGGDTLPFLGLVNNGLGWHLSPAHIYDDDYEPKTLVPRSNIG